MSAGYRKYLLGQAVVGAVINFVLNGAIGWMLYRHLPRTPLYGEQSIAGDIVVTSLLLPLLVCLIVTPLVRREVQRGRLPAADWLGPHSKQGARVLGNWLLRGVVLGVLSTLLVSPVAIWALRAVGVDGLDFWTFVTLKASIAATLAAVITPMVAAWALADGLRASGAGFIAGPRG